MNIEHQRIGCVIGYCCQFIKNPDEAVAHILCLITTRKVEFDKDPAFYRERLREMLEDYPLQRLNDFGEENFTEDQWRVILQGVVNQLE